MLVCLGIAAPAWGHSFLATTRPAQGERLDGPPREVALQLSEPVDADTVRVDVTDGGVTVAVGQLELDDGGAVVRLPLVSPGDGLYRVEWHVTSAVDSHQSTGEFAFAVGDGDAVTITGATQNEGSVSRPSPLGTAATWLLLAGWSIAFGAGALALRATGTTFPRSPRSWIRAGTLAALAGIGARLVLAPGQQAAIVGLLVATLLAMALALVGARRVWPAVTALGAFAVVWPARGHAAVSPVGWALDAVHLTAAGLWVGGLTVAVTALAVAVRRGRPGQALPLVRAYAQLAVAAVAVLMVTGLALGWSLVPSLQALTGDAYGRLVAVKAALAVVALAAASMARRRLAASDAVRLRRTTRVEHVTLVGALLVAALLVDSPPRPPTVETLLGPPPIEGPVARAAGLAGHMTVDVQVGDGRLDVNTRGPSGGIDADLDLAAVLPDGTELELHPRPCGQGCGTLPLDLPPGRTRFTARAEAEDWTGGTTTLDVHWPPPQEDPALFERMRRAMAGVDQVVVIERFEQDPDPAASGPRMSGTALVELMPWAGGGVVDVRPVPGEPRRFTFHLPGSYSWFDVTVDHRDRLVRQRLVNLGHDIHYRFRYPPADPAPEVAN